MTTTTSAPNFQDGILNQVRKDNIPVLIHLTNGFPLRGFVKGFDNFTITLETEGKHQLIYKNAISTVTPQSGVSCTNKDTVKNKEYK